MVCKRKTHFSQVYSLTYEVVVTYCSSFRHFHPRSRSYHRIDSSQEYTVHRNRTAALPRKLNQYNKNKYTTFKIGLTKHYFRAKYRQVVVDKFRTSIFFWKNLKQTATFIFYRSAFCSGPQNEILKTAKKNQISGNMHHFNIFKMAAILTSFPLIWS